jgi:hypothetical protein
MIEKIYFLIDEWYNAIPFKVRKIIMLLSIVIWILAALIISAYSFLKGRENAPVIGEERYTNSIKEKMLRIQNLNKKHSIVLPDLNDLIQEEKELPLKIQSLDENKNIQNKIELSEGKTIEILPQKEELIFPKKQELNEPISEKDLKIEELKNNSLEKSEEKKNKKLEILKIEN